MKDEIIKIRNRLTELDKYYRAKISDNMKNQKMLNLISNLSNSIMVAYRNLDTAVFYLQRMEELNGKKYDDETKLFYDKTKQSESGK